MNALQPAKTCLLVSFWASLLAGGAWAGTDSGPTTTSAPERNAAPRAVAAGPITAAAATLVAPRTGFNAAIVSLTLTAQRPLRLVSASLAGAASTRLQLMRREGSAIDVQTVAAVDLPAGQALRFRTGADQFHVLARGFQSPPQAGRVLPLSLQFEEPGSGRRHALRVPVQVLPARGGHDGPDEH